MKKLLLTVFILCTLTFLLSCQQANLDDPSTLDTLVDVTAALITANAASATLNPYFLPVSVGLAGVSAMLEALRRKEKSARKHAEHELNSNGNNITKP